MQLDTISPPQVIGGLPFNWNFDSTTPSSVNLLTERGEVPPPESENKENEPPNTAAGGARQSVVPYLENRIEDFHINPAKRSMKRKSSSTRMIGREEISKHFGKSMDEAATILKVSRSTLKRICRSLGIPRWPYRNGPDMSDVDTLMESNKTDVAVHTSEGSLAQVSGAFNISPGGTTHLARNPAVLTKKIF
ncbi:putative transcription factor Nin-like family [Helianthus debilis subsp. tardiflorus]